MARDAQFDITATDRSGPAVEGAADNFDRLGDEASRASRKVDELGDQTGQLARKLALARVEALGLAREFNRTGDSKLLKEFGKVNNEAARLGRVMKTLKLGEPNTSHWLDGITKAGQESGNILVRGIANAFDALPAQAKTAVVVALGGAAAVAAPIIAGAIEGAVIGGIGAGGIVTGFILGAQDPAVAAAYKRLGNNIMLDLRESAKPFTADLLATAPKFERAWDAESARVKRIFATLSLAVGPLVDKSIESFHKIMPAIERAAAASVPLIRAIAQQLPELADDVGELIDAFTAGGPGAAAAIGLIIFQLRGLISLLAFGAQASAPFLNAFGKLAEASRLVPQTGNYVTDLSDTLVKSGTSASMAAGGYNNLAFSMQNTADRAQALNDAFNRLFSEQMNVDQANLAVNAGMLQLKETIKDNKKTLDQSTESGVENTRVILEQIRALDAKRQADIAAGNGTAEATAAANAAYASQVAALRQVLISMGLVPAEVDRLIAAYNRIPRTITTTINTVYRTSGVRPGQSDEATGHSRTGTEDYSGVSGWRPAQFAASGRNEFASGGSGPKTPPVQVHSENSFTVLLDGQPFRAVAVRTVAAAEARQAWRAKVGRR